MQINTLQSLFKSFKEDSLFGRYIHLKHIEPLLKKLSSKVNVEVVGSSVLNKSIYTIAVGNGKKKILMWSQMHGNESTTTKAIFDLLNFLNSNHSIAKDILEQCSLKIIPILNPDGAEKYTRLNANNTDLNRDAQNLAEPESMILNNCFNEFKPDFCFNLHGQRTIFGAGKLNEPATISFLAPAQDEATTITKNRKEAMNLIHLMNEMLQNCIPNQVGIYDDAFNLNCVGDTFQSFGVPTVLFEAGHFHKDYNREVTREYMFYSLLTAIHSISSNDKSENEYESYFEIPMNATCFYDIIIRNAKLNIDKKDKIVDVAFQYQEVLDIDRIKFSPKIVAIDDLKSYKGHLEVNANEALLKGIENESINVGYENDFVLLNNEELSLKLT